MYDNIKTKLVESYDEIMTGLIEAIVIERNKNKEESLVETYNSIRNELSLHINEKVRKQIEEDFKDYVRRNQGNN